MLLNIHVNNFALIDEADIDLEGGLNILTGETGAGKSILIDSVNAALGGRLRSDVIGSYGDSAFVSLMFSIDDDKKKHALEKYEIDTDFDTILISRKISQDRSIFKINDKPVTAGTVKKITEILIDIHGQHEHQSLLKPEIQLEILDHFAGNESLLADVSIAYKEYQSAKATLKSFDLDEEARKREEDFIAFEINEIEKADIKEGERETLEETYKKSQSSNKLADYADEALKALSDGRENASDLLARAYKAINMASDIDSDIINILRQVEDASTIVSEAIRDLNSYSNDLSYDPIELNRIEMRLDEINHIESKYGKDYEAVMKALSDRQDKLAKLKDYEAGKENALKDFVAKEDNLRKIAIKLSESRKLASKGLVSAITTELKELNFLEINFDIQFSELSEITEKGLDNVSYIISTNPGENLRPLSEVASGGELSRIMLGFKTVLSDKDEIPSLIFDEIDAGISGKTAWMVSNKLKKIAKYHQVICITHLPQIAASADAHYCIEKGAESGHTKTNVSLLDENGELMELARLLGGNEISDAVISNAKELKQKAKE